MRGGAGRMELHKAPVLHPSVSPCWAQGREAAGDGTKWLQASQLQLPSWHGEPETGTGEKGASQGQASPVLS